MDDKDFEKTISFANIKLANESEMARFGLALAKILRAGDFIALYGDLGAGKTTLARAIINAIIGQSIEVPSPTFTLLQSYDAPQFTIYHFDLYRLKSPDEIWELGWEDIADVVTLCEWPQNAGENLPVNRLEITLSFGAIGRIATLSAKNQQNAPHSWRERLKSVFNEFI